MEQKQQTNYAKGIYLRKKISKKGQEYLELSIKTEGGYDKYVCLPSKVKDMYGNDTFAIIVKSNENLPF